MTYQVFVTENAEHRLAEYHDFIAQDSPVEAARWLAEMGRKMDSLATFPEGYSYARENDTHTRTLRQLVHGKCRIIFHVDEDAVYVVSIRHTSQLPHQSGELDKVR